MRVFRQICRLCMVLSAVIIAIHSIEFALAEVAIPTDDQTQVAPLNAPDPATTDPRYVSGFGLDDNYVIFYEDRADRNGCPYGSRIYFVRAVGSPFNFSSPTQTDICDTHFVVKDWPVTIGGTTYAYRGWGSVGNNPNHNFYVSNDLVHWVANPTTGSFFTFVDDTGTGQTVYYGFHDIIRLNGHYMGFAETNTGHTVIVWSAEGTNDWHVVAVVGGGTSANLGPLYFPTGIGPTPTGNFLLLEVNGEKVYGKLSVPGDNSGAWLAINKAAAQAATPAEAEAAFLDPNNWTWSDGSTGAPDNDSLVLPATAQHDVREVWSPPVSDYRANPPIVYTARYGNSGSDMGCAATTVDCTVDFSDVPTPTPTPTAAPRLPLTGFPPVAAPRLLHRQRAAHATGLALQIPALGVYAPIVGVPREGNGWDVSWLGNAAGWLQGSAFPTWEGNTVLTGHVWNADNTPGVFVRLKDLRFDDRIVIHAWGLQYVYAVRENRLLTPNDVNAVMQHKTRDWLTLLTCEGYFAPEQSYRYRRMVRAVLVEVRP